MYVCPVLPIEIDAVTHATTEYRLSLNCTHDFLNQCLPTFAFMSLINTISFALCCFQFDHMQYHSFDYYYCYYFNWHCCCLSLLFSFLSIISVTLFFYVLHFKKTIPIRIGFDENERCKTKLHVLHTWCTAHRYRLNFKIKKSEIRLAYTLSGIGYAWKQI